MEIRKTVVILFIMTSITLTENLAWGDSDDSWYTWEELLEQFPEIFDSTVKVESSNSGNQIKQQPKPTFGLDHETNRKMIDEGFQINNKTFVIRDNFHTPFSQQEIIIGETNTIEAKVFADKGLRIQEFLFGIPDVSQAHLAELGVEVWFDREGEIQQVKAIQKTNVIDESTLVAKHEKSKCLKTDVEENCDSVKITVVFLEPLKDKVMALKAIDFKNNYQITYLNEGVKISGESLNPMKTMMIPTGVKGEGLLQVEQTDKYSPYWASEDERMFEMNHHGSFNLINYEFKRFQDLGTPKTRLHSGFGGMIAYEQEKAVKLFDASKFISELPDSFVHNFPERNGRISEELALKMLNQEEIAQKILDEFKVQARW